MQQLQLYDGVVKSIRQVRPVFPELSDTEFATWYSERYKITLPRVLTILEYLKEYE
ncbi:hypothetical protein [Paenibacillus sp. LjRoot56]|uniref:hypothetical protein n=1 Tax=Paenibacillus sp. LjRoot56 TaxID=3342333 RepID=UPI003ECF2FA9